MSLNNIFPYTSGSAIGYNVGLAGGLMMLALLMYPVRKHVRRMQGFGPLKYWFRAHMTGGVLGPVLILLHSTLRLGSLNATVAFFCMMLVMTSGLVGRFVYRRIHHGLYGRRATMQELTTELAQQFDALAPAMERMPAAQARIEAFAEDAKLRHTAAWQRVIHFTGMAWRRRTVARQTRMEIASRLRATTSETDRQRLLALESSVHHTLSSIQATAQFRTYERLFALWHVAHIPFLYMLAFTAAFHVLAVHMY